MWGTESVDNPDLRDRAFIYWRLLSTDPMGAKAIVLSEKPLSDEGALENIDPTFLHELLGNIGSLASIYHKPMAGFERKKKGVSTVVGVGCNCGSHSFVALSSNRPPLSQPASPPKATLLLRRQRSSRIFILFFPPFLLRTQS